MDRLGIQGSPSTAYHPQTDGLTECYNQELKTYLRLYVDYHQTDWVKFLKTAQFSYNNTIHSAHGHTPFFASTGRHPYSGLNPRAKNTVPAATEYAQQLGKVQEEVKAALEQSKADMKATYDLHHQDARKYEEGQRVWLEGTNLHSRRPSQALNERRYGPFEIVEKIGTSAYRLAIPDTWKIHDVFNESLLTPFHAPQFRNQQPPGPPPPELVDDHVEYVVEAVINSRVVGRIGNQSMLYLVKWQGYPESENSWEPEDNLYPNAVEAIDDYHRTHPHRKRVSKLIEDD